MPAFKQQTIVDFVTAESASATQQQLQAVHNGRGFCEQASVKVLETYLAEQVQNSTVDIDADLALLKLYLVYPATVNAENVAKVLVKGVMALPSTFFTGASTLVPESIREDASVTAVLHTGFLLQSCLFEDFWKEEVTFAKKVPGFLESVRAYILTAISRSHSAISTEVFKAKLNVSDKEVADIVAAEKWTVADNLVQISPNEDNQMQAKKVQENIEFEDVLKVIHTLSR
ncbi:hypothetical protein PRIC1_008780 [Phytophthora ramorum]|uniref:Eukaryotic translation initiation factor 3 subunit K n=1 Tax=Phytophthora ramorum TaxID=164328 RepID=H3GXI5_PHYRM|nr:Eukaryotic translation initiation factor 3 subunit K [Phytophthora ramorum]KAH7505361.1 Eukaryotic translation initiation factor 3 subunit K [Phytophthora ramorum]